MKAHLIAFITVAIGVSVLAKADSMESQPFSATVSTTNLGLLPFNTALGTLDSIAYSVMFTGTLPDGDDGSASLTIPFLSASGGLITPCLETAGCPIMLTRFASDDTTPADLASAENTFTQTVTINPDFLNPTFSGTITYNYTPVVAAVPEPASWGLLMTLIGMCLIVRKRIALLR